MAAIDAVEAPPPNRFSRWKRIAPFLLLGPISGPLLAGVVFNYRAGRRKRAALYAVALVAFMILLPYVTAMVGLKDMALFGLKAL
jgi:hypothetical protein